MRLLELQQLNLYPGPAGQPIRLAVVPARAEPRYQPAELFGVVEENPDRHIRDVQALTRS
ncbi:hypothetical protein Aple_103590 [Acrocarpospora pleiomorpha]|uniref:Uncharacterized protein n=1 Tax=Acrocarpospora pleiomorpha TaxID=90975 RepID=A0A5M3Y4M6_9ACTN|nr:hypothetical protein Aple_103590 [Acrocarpospora pleiomorpha]